ncbi:hypothetical protein WA158_001237 [Blastocystis sp. Blastoise]
MGIPSESNKTVQDNKTNNNQPIKQEVAAIPENTDEVDALVDQVEEIVDKTEKEEVNNETKSTEVSEIVKGAIDPSQTPVGVVEDNSVFVQQVDYSVTPEQLSAEFATCGVVRRVTILCNNKNQPKGCAYIEFADKEAAQTALLHDNTQFAGRTIKVSLKRKNLPRFILRGSGRNAHSGRGGKAPRGRMNMTFKP